MKANPSKAKPNSTTKIPLPLHTIPKCAGCQGRSRFIHFHVKFAANFFQETNQEVLIPKANPKALTNISVSRCSLLKAVPKPINFQFQFTQTEWLFQSQFLIQVQLFVYKGQYQEVPTPRGHKGQIQFRSPLIHQLHQRPRGFQERPIQRPIYLTLTLTKDQYHHQWPTEGQELNSY